MKYGNVIFDFDGTLFNTFEGIAVSINQALEAMDQSVLPKDKLKSFIGPSLIEAFRDHTPLDEAQIKKVIALFRGLYSGGNYALCAPYEGIPELLKKLKREGVKLSIASNKPENFIDKILARFNMSGYFDCIIGIKPGEEAAGSDKTENLRHALLAKPAVMIGDRKYDLQAAETVGIDAVGALYGYGDVTELKAYPSVLLANSAKEIQDFLFK